MLSRVPVIVGMCCVTVAACATAADPGVDFNRDIRPLLSDNCFQCHGPDAEERQADLRLDSKSSAFGDREGYDRAIIPGKPEKSPIFERITAEDEFTVMPPPSSGKQLDAAEIESIRKWIAEGAKWQEHWAYVAPARPEVPEPAAFNTPNATLIRNEIDRFIQRRLKERNLKPSEEADRITLIRRLSFDLTGLPPSPAEVDAFLADESDHAYEVLVDRLLASPAFGERMAMYWLDLVRYGDTGGYHSDNHRDVWLYRDWVIRAFNESVPFDQFTIEQLAGDLLDDPTREQKIASGYNRLLLTTEEGGAQPKEYQAKYDADRVRNASSVWLGATMACCECHDHKFDPYTAKDFYSFASFFADIAEKSVGRQTQTPMPMPDQKTQLDALDTQLTESKQALATSMPELVAARKKWEESFGTGPNADDELPKNIRAILDIVAAKRSDKQRADLAAYYITIAPSLAPVREQIATLEKRKQALVERIPTTLISTSVKPRTIRVLNRGDWMDDSGEVVTPAIPAFLGTIETGGRRPTRLDLARWFVDEKNPLTARVMVNRMWKLMYGEGLVRSLADFGSQGVPPTHPELLDWLAVEFVDSGWDMKHMLKLMVMSHTYRQSSYTSPELRQADPSDKWLARQSSFRLPAEMIRDNALSVSGLLANEIGGPSVKPYQPDGYWSNLNWPRRKWVEDDGTDQHRRGLYTYWQRTFLHPSLMAFDAPSREMCVAERPRSKTPLQALALLNDPTYVEAARAFAERILREGGKTDAARLEFAWREATARRPREAEVELLTRLVEKHRVQYTADVEAANKLLSIGQRPVPRDLDSAELAAWTSAARVILNLRETVTRS